MKPMAPGSILHHISSHQPANFCRHSLFCNLYFPIYKPKIPKVFTLPFVYFIYLYQISLLQVTVKGLTTPLSRWVQVIDCLCRYSATCALSPTGLIPWFSKTEGNTYTTLLHHPFLFKGKPTQCSRGSNTL